MSDEEHKEDNMTIYVNKAEYKKFLSHQANIHKSTNIVASSASFLLLTLLEVQVNICGS